MKRRTVGRECTVVLVFVGGFGPGLHGSPGTAGASQVRLMELGTSGIMDELFPAQLHDALILLVTRKLSVCPCLSHRGHRTRVFFSVMGFSFRQPTR
jgi:hypothetical protein